MENKHKQFKPFDKVLVRDHENVWNPDIYGFWDKCRDNHVTITDAYISDADILPYEGNAHLVGTTDEPEEKIILGEGEWVVFCDEPDFDFRNNIVVGIFSRIVNDVFYLKHWCESFFEYAIRFSDFNPNDMEETKKHILCARDGKIVKYKE